MPDSLTNWHNALEPLSPGRGVLLWGEEIRSLAAAAMAWGVARGAKVLVVDAANRFDPYGLVREARRRGIARETALARVKVARAFTSHQLVRLVREELARQAEPGSLVIILGPVSLFYDEQVPLAERLELFKSLTESLTAIKSRAALLLLQPYLPRGAANRHFGHLLRPIMDCLVEVGGRARVQKDLRGGPGDRWSPALPSNSPPNPRRRGPGKAEALPPTLPAK